jgi:serine O-acetyltransferase
VLALPSAMDARATGSRSSRIGLRMGRRSARRPGSLRPLSGSWSGRSCQRLSAPTSRAAAATMPDVADPTSKPRSARRMSPEWLWLLSIRLHQRKHPRLARWARNVNSFLYHNSLAVGADVSPDVFLAHHGLGTVVHMNVVIGRRVWIWHNVTIAVRAGNLSPYRIIIEDDVRIGAHSVIISPYRADLRIGRGARIGAGAIVTKDVPAGSTVVSKPSEARPSNSERVALGSRSDDGSPA